MLTLYAVVPLVVQTWVLIATQEVHIYLFTFSVYCLHSSGRQRYYFSVEDPRKSATLRSVFDPSARWSAADIMRDCGEKLRMPVRSSWWGSHRAASPRANSGSRSHPCGWRSGMHACRVDLTDHQLAERGNERSVWERGSTTVKCSPWAIMINHQQFLCNHWQCAHNTILYGKNCREKSITLYYCRHALLTSVGVHTFHTWFVSTGGRLEQCGQFGQWGKTEKHFQARGLCLWIECYFTKKSTLFRCKSCIHFMKYPEELHGAVPSFGPISEYL